MNPELPDIMSVTIFNGNTDCYIDRNHIRLKLQGMT